MKTLNKIENPNKMCLYHISNEAEAEGYEIQFIDCETMTMAEILMPVVTPDETIIHTANENLWVTEDNKPTLIFIANLDKAAPEIRKVLGEAIASKKLKDKKLGNQVLLVIE